MNEEVFMQEKIKAVALVCTLSQSSNASSSELMARQVLDELKQYDVDNELLRVADYDIKPGVEIDMGDGDAWPAIRQKIMEADILFIATPIWVGHPSSMAQKVIERLDAELGETDSQGRLMTYGKVGIVAVVGNEDGAHKVTADLFQALNDVGFTIPASGSTYWVGEAMNKVDYKDLDRIPDNVAAATKSLATNAAHLARLLKQNEYPPLT
jgi:multimeric flavodoxin WrbA